MYQRLGVPMPTLSQSRSAQEERFGAPWDRHWMRRRPIHRDFDRCPHRDLRCYGDTSFLASRRVLLPFRCRYRKEVMFRL